MGSGSRKFINLRHANGTLIIAANAQEMYIIMRLARISEDDRLLLNTGKIKIIIVNRADNNSPHPLYVAD